MLILFLSAVFTIPTMYDWMKNIPKKIMEPHAERVYIQRDEIIERYTIMKKKSKKLVVQVSNDLKAAIKVIIFNWKNGEKRKIIKGFIIIIAVVMILFLLLWLSNYLTMLADKSIEWVGIYYNNLERGVQETVITILVLSFLVGIMLRALFMVPRIYHSEGNRIEKTKHIIVLIIFEIVLGFVTGMVLNYS